jgi:hypothetical protein
MTPQDFIAAMEQQMVKQAAGGMGALVPKVVQTTRIPRAAGPGMFQRGLNAVQQGAGIAADESLTALDNLGRVTRHGAGKAMEAGKNFVDGFRGKPDTTYRKRLTNSNPNERGVIPYSAPDSRGLKPYRGELRNYTPPGRTWGNIGTGAGVAGLTAAGLTAANPYRRGGQVPPPMPMPMRQQQQGEGGLMDMWNNLPIEARYAIGAGVPLALMGAFAGGNGNSGLGMGMGAAGLGLAGLGAAQGGYFGKNMQGGAQSIMNMLNGSGGQDPHYSAYLQGRLGNDLDNNSGRSVKKSSSLQNFGALVEKTSAGRCWTGYEPVPGKAPYSNDSCRPKGQKAKKKPAEKAAVAGCGKTSMPETPSSRGTVKKISDHMAGTPSPKPTDAENQTQKASQAHQWAAQLRADMDKEAFLGGMARSVGNAIGGAGNYVQTGLNNFADRSEQAGNDMYYGGMRTLNKITNPFNQAGAAVGGFIQGGIQGAKNIAALPGQVTTAAGNAISSGIDTVAALPGQAATAAGNAIQSGVDTAKSYIPSVRNPFHYPGQPGQTPQPAGAM